MKAMNMRYWIAIIVLLLLSNISDLYGQNNQPVIGKVTDAQSGETLPGVNILVKGTTIGASTDEDGNFELEVPSLQDTLVVTYIGYQRQEVPINGRSQIDIQLTPEAIMGEEMVVVGYGTQRKADLTGSISSVNSEDLEYAPNRSVSSMLQGSVAGVNVVQGSEPGSGSIVRIRGGNSMRGGNDPLYVVDGFPGGSIGDPSNIESIEVLKDASATAIYGARGANGVIIVTTKRGSETPEISMNIDYGFQQPRKKLDLLEAREYAEFANEKANNIGISPYYPNTNDLPGSTDWQDEIFQTAPISNYDISIAGGNDNNRYAIFGNYSTEEGIIANTGFSSGDLKINLDNKITEWFDISTSILGSQNVTNKTFIRSSFQGIVYRAIQAPPMAPVKDESGNYFSIAGLPTGDPLWDNPKAILDGTNDKNRSNNLEGNTNLEFDILPSLEFDLRLGSKYTNSRNDTYLERIMKDGGTGSIASISESNSYQYLVDAIVSYSSNFSEKHNLTIDTGFNWEQNIYTVFSAGGSEFVKDNLKTNNLSSASTIDAPSSSKSKSTIISGIGRVNYQFDNRYLATITARADGSSKFGANNNWGFFPSIGLGWRLSEEDFLKRTEFIDNLKIRGSYGLTGNQDIGNYQSLARLSSATAIFGAQEARYTGFYPSILENPDLKWEITSQYNIGFDLSTFNQRLDVTVDYYKKNTSDLLATVPLPRTSGFSSILKNFGEIENEGFEAVINALIIQDREWSYSIGANFSLNKNKVITVANESGDFFAGSLSDPISGPVNIIKEGHPISSHYGYLEDGLWENDQGPESIQPNAKAGDQKYVDINDDGTISPADKKIIGSSFPDFTYGLNTNLNYKQFDFYVLIQGVQGGEIFNANKFTIGDSFARNGNQLEEVKDHWSEQNQDPNAKYPRLSNVSPEVSERFVEDGSYLRFKTISLGYNISASNIEWLRNARLYIRAENYFTLTKYSGYDPEVSSTGSSSLVKGVDMGAYPPSKTMTLGIKVNL